MPEHVCKHCKRTFESPRSLAGHLKVHQQSASCPLCGEVVRYMAPHLKKVHKDDPLVQLESSFLKLVDEVRRLRIENRQLKEESVSPDN